MIEYKIYDSVAYYGHNFFSGRIIGFDTVCFDIENLIQFKIDGTYKYKEQYNLI